MQLDGMQTTAIQTNILSLDLQLGCSIFNTSDRDQTILTSNMRFSRCCCQQLGYANEIGYAF